jgi:diacylglycerol kinase (ATP)
MRHHTVIYNPAAAQGKAGERLEHVKADLMAAGIDFTLHVTERVGHATDLAAQAATDGKTDVVVSAGGDGTANEVINGLMRVVATSPQSMPALGVLCVGRGNDFAHGVGVPNDVPGGIAVLQAGAEAPMDVGFLRGGDYPQGRYFGNGIGVGFDTIVGLEAAKLKWIRGFAAYLVAAFKTLLFFYKTPRLRMEIDSNPVTQECVQVSIMNGQRLGGAFFMAPDALTGDGHLDLCIAGKPKRGQMLGILLKYMKGSQAESAHVTTGHAKSIIIKAEEGTMPVHADGETICIAGTDLAVECVHAPLRVVTRKEDTAE